MESCQGTVVREVKFLRSGTGRTSCIFRTSHAKKTATRYNDILYASGLNFSVHEHECLKQLGQRTDGIFDLASLFCMRLQTESRIIGSNPAQAFEAIEGGVSHPIQMLFLNDDLESKISDYFHQAFGEDLIVYRLGSNEIPLLVGQRLVPQQR